jgi:hypothetical protein
MKAKFTLVATYTDTTYSNMDVDEMCGYLSVTIKDTYRILSQSPGSVTLQRATQRHGRWTRSVVQIVTEYVPVDVPFRYKAFARMRIDGQFASQSEATLIQGYLLSRMYNAVTIESEYLIKEFTQIFAPVKVW